MNISDSTRPGASPSRRYVPSAPLGKAADRCIIIEFVILLARDLVLPFPA